MTQIKLGRRLWLDSVSEELHSVYRCNNSRIISIVTIIIWDMLWNTDIYSQHLEIQFLSRQRSNIVKYLFAERQSTESYLLLYHCITVQWLHWCSVMSAWQRITVLKLLQDMYCFSCVLTEIPSPSCSCFVMVTDLQSKPILLIHIKRVTGHKALDSCHRYTVYIV